MWDGLLVHAAEESLQTYMDGTYGGNLSGQQNLYFIPMAYCSHSLPSLHCKKANEIPGFPWILPFLILENTHGR